MASPVYVRCSFWKCGGHSASLTAFRARAALDECCAPCLGESHGRGARQPKIFLLHAWERLDIQGYPWLRAYCVGFGVRLSAPRRGEVRDRCNNDIVEDVTLSGLLFAFDKLACFRVSNLVAVCWRSESDDVRLHSARTFRSHLTHNIDAPFDIEYIYLLRINVHVQPVAGQSPGALESSPPPVVHPFFLCCCHRSGEDPYSS